MVKKHWFFFQSFFQKAEFCVIMGFFYGAIIIGVMFSEKNLKKTVMVEKENHITLTITQQWVRYYRHYGVIMPEVVFAQNVLETGYFRSAVARAPIIEGDIVIQKGSNNHFGMKRNSRSYGVSPRGGKVPSWCADHVHACYTNPTYGAKDYAHWQLIRLDAYCQYFGKPIPKTVEEYFHFLNNLVLYNKEGKPFLARYAEDKRYTSKLKTLMQFTIPKRLGSY